MIGGLGASAPRISGKLLRHVIFFYAWFSKQRGRRFGCFFDDKFLYSAKKEHPCASLSGVQTNRKGVFLCLLAI